jgi:hypothetical protein
VFDHRRSPRQEAATPIRFRLRETEAEGFIVNLSGTGALFRFDPALPIGPHSVGQTVEFTSWHDVGALIRPRGTAVRFFEAPEGNHLAIRYLPE